MKKPSSKAWFLLLIPLFLILAYLVYNFPPVNDRLSWRIEELKTRIAYLINPPDEAIFVPIGDTPKSTPPAIPTVDTTEPTLEGITQESISEEPQITGPPLPEQIILDGVVYVNQQERWNYCGPANLTMALNYWGWPGDRDDVARVVKPGINDPDLDFIQQGRLDKNVMPSEMIGFVVDHTDFNIIARYGGNLELIKSFIASGFPVMVEKGYYEADYTGKVAWLGHYMYTTGYDDLKGEFIVQDSNILKGNTAEDHQNKRVDYETYLEGWRSFNYLLMVIYPPERQEEVLQILGPWQDPFWAYQHALEIAEEEIQSLSGVDEFFALFNKGASLVKMERYLDAGEAFDQAYKIYNQLADDETTRPYRITWYQTWPYWAYYYSGRYQDVINMADFTLETIAEPTLEETLYWRGLAYYALGKKALAKSDLYNSVWLNPNFEAGLIQISNLNFDD